MASHCCDKEPRDPTLDGMRRNSEKNRIHLTTWNMGRLTDMSTRISYIFVRMLYIAVLKGTIGKGGEAKEISDGCKLGKGH